MFPCRRTPVAIELENHIGLGHTNIVKRHPCRSVPRLGEERYAATELDQVRRQVPADQNGTRGIGNTPVRVSIIVYAHTILQEDGWRRRPFPLPRLCLVASECQLCGYACGFRRCAEQHAELLDMLIQIVQSPGVKVEQGIGRHAKRLGLMDAERPRPGGENGLRLESFHRLTICQWPGT